MIKIAQTENSENEFRCAKSLLRLCDLVMWFQSKDPHFTLARHRVSSSSVARASGWILERLVLKSQTLIHDVWTSDISVIYYFLTEVYF